MRKKLSNLQRLGLACLILTTVALMAKYGQAILEWWRGAFC